MRGPSPPTSRRVRSRLPPAVGGSTLSMLGSQFTVIAISAWEVFSSSPTPRSRRGWWACSRLCRRSSRALRRVHRGRPPPPAGRVVDHRGTCSP
ncbi:hypothetical protein QJS66_15290 [Kocuria rhizophila]|nr:hypothetical protein QJS66_15290 [Kocuria rhizophila]